ncbi:hypothetical protein, partial [Bacillus subtilis]
GDPLVTGLSGLVHQRLAKRVMALDEELVPTEESVQILDMRDTRELSFRTAVAVLTREHQVPHSVQILLEHENQTGKTRDKRISYLNLMYNLSLSASGGTRWRPTFELPPAF